MLILGCKGLSRIEEHYVMRKMFITYTVWQMSDSELFPVSMFEVDSGEHQPIDPQKNDEIEPLEGENATERCELLHIPGA